MSTGDGAGREEGSGASGPGESRPGGDAPRGGRRPQQRGAGGWAVGGDEQDGSGRDGRTTGGMEDDVRELLGAYAVDAVDDVERRAVERLVREDPEVAAELAELQWVAVRLGEAVVAEPPAGLRDAVLASVRGVPQLPRPVVAGDDVVALRSAVRSPAAPVPAAVPAAAGEGDGVDWSGRRAERAARRPSRVRLLAVAAAFVAAVAVPGTLAVQQAQRAGDAEAAQLATAQSIADLLTDPAATVVRGELASGGSAAAVYTSGAALFSASDVPAAGEGKAYQLWVVDGTVIRSAGVMQQDGDALVQLVDDYGSGALAVTLEPASGSEQPTTTPLVVLAEV